MNYLKELPSKMAIAFRRFPLTLVWVLFGSIYMIGLIETDANLFRGFYAETYRSKDRLHESKLPDRYKSPRVFGTSIYFLLTTGSVSNFHRLNSDEIWHFHTGGAAKVHFIDRGGNHTEHLIGADFENGQLKQKM